MKSETIVRANLRSIRGAVSILVLLFSALFLILFNVFSGKLVSYLNLSLLNAHHMNTDLAISSIIDYAAYGLKNRWCFNSSLTNDANCDLSHPGSSDRLLMSNIARDSILDYNALISSLGSATTLSPMNVPAPPATLGISEIKTSIQVSTMTSAHPLSILVGLIAKANIGTININIRRVENWGTPTHGNEVLVRINVELLTKSGVGSTTGTSPFIGEALFFVAPRELDTYSLVVSHDLLVGNTPKHTTEPGDFRIPKGNKTDVGFHFDSPVLVNGDLYLPANSFSKSATPVEFSPVRFASTVNLGATGLIHTGANLLAPTTAGAADDRYLRTPSTFNGLMGGVNMTGFTDWGLENFRGKTPTVTPDATLMNRCMDRLQKHADLRKTNKADLVIKYLNPNDIVSGNNDLYKTRIAARNGTALLGTPVATTDYGMQYETSDSLAPAKTHTNQEMHYRLALTNGDFFVPQNKTRNPFNQTASGTDDAGIEDQNNPSFFSADSKTNTVDPKAFNLTSIPADIINYYNTKLSPNTGLTMTPLEIPNFLLDPKLDILNQAIPPRYLKSAVPGHVPSDPVNQGPILRLQFFVHGSFIFERRLPAVVPATDATVSAALAALQTAFNNSGLGGSTEFIYPDPSWVSLGLPAINYPLYCLNQFKCSMIANRPPDPANPDTNLKIGLDCANPASVCGQQLTALANVVNTFPGNTSCAYPARVNPTAPVNIAPHLGLSQGRLPATGDNTYASFGTAALMGWGGILNFTPMYESALFNTATCDITGPEFKYFSAIMDLKNAFNNNIDGNAGNFIYFRDTIAGIITQNGTVNPASFDPTNPLSCIVNQSGPCWNAVKSSPPNGFDCGLTASECGTDIAAMDVALSDFVANKVPAYNVALQNYKNALAALGTTSTSTLGTSAFPVDPNAFQIEAEVVPLTESQDPKTFGSHIQDNQLDLIVRFKNIDQANLELWDIEIGVEAFEAGKGFSGPKRQTVISYSAARANGTPDSDYLDGSTVFFDPTGVNGDIPKISTTYISPAEYQPEYGTDAAITIRRSIEPGKDAGGNIPLNQWGYNLYYCSSGSISEALNVLGFTTPYCSDTSFYPNLNRSFAKQNRFWAGNELEAQPDSGRVVDGSDQTTVLDSRIYNYLGRSAKTNINAATSPWPGIYNSSYPPFLDPPVFPITGSGTALTTDTVELAALCNQQSGSGWAAVNTPGPFADHSVESWQLNQRESVDPMSNTLTKDLLIDGSTSDYDSATGTYPTFRVRSVQGTCTIDATAQVVAGFYVCESLVIKARTKPLYFYGTMIVGANAKGSIAPSALTNGIYFKSIYHPSAVFELRKLKILKSSTGEGCEDDTDSLGKIDPDWNPLTNLYKESKHERCGVGGLSNLADSFSWTTFDPDCGQLSGSSKVVCQNLNKIYVTREVYRKVGR